MGDAEHDDGGDPRVPRGQMALLADPVFGPFFFGKLLSTGGVWIHNIAAAIVVFNLTRSATYVGAVSVAQFAPQLLLTPWSGARADRHDRRRQLVAGRLIAASGSFGLVLWHQLVGLSGVEGAYAVILASGTVGVGFALGGPAMQALVPSLVRPSELAAAVAMNSVPFTIGRSAGPALGAVLLATGGPSVTFGIAGAGNAAFAVILLLLTLPDQPARPRTSDHPIRAGLRMARRDRVLLSLLLGAAAVGVGADPVITLTPSLADRLGGADHLVGALASAFGVGAGVAFLLLGRARSRFGISRLGPQGLLLLAAGMGGAAVPITPVALGSLFLAGGGMTLALTSFTTAIQMRAPDEFRGRVMSLWAMCFLGSRPIAAAVSGRTADAISVVAALALVCVILLLAAWQTRRAVGRLRSDA